MPDSQHAQQVSELNVQLSEAVQQLKRLRNDLRAKEAEVRSISVDAQTAREREGVASSQVAKLRAQVKQLRQVSGGPRFCVWNGARASVVFCGVEVAKTGRSASKCSPHPGELPSSQKLDQASHAKSSQQQRLEDQLRGCQQQLQESNQESVRVYVCRFAVVLT